MRLQAQRDLLSQLLKREILNRYRGSFLGVLWSLLTPLFMLGVYTFVFAYVFKARWGVGDTTGEFALILFVGLILHGLLAEILNRSPLLILQQPNYVKKVVFPLRLLPLVTVLTAVCHLLLSLIILMAALLFFQSVSLTVLLIPVVLLPYVLLLLGMSYCLATVGVYFRDIAHIAGLLTTVLLFVSPVFFPRDILPENYQVFILLNPLSFIVESARQVILFNQTPNWFGLGIYSLVALGIFLLGYSLFEKTRQGFADAL